MDKLWGASHVYLWRDGNSPPALEALRELGYERLLLIYDGDLISAREASRLSERANRLGFLVGNYDSYDNIQDPKTADGSASRFDEWLWEHGAIVNADGKKRRSFAGRGYELSSEALRNAEPEHHYLQKRREERLP